MHYKPCAQPQATRQVPPVEVYDLGCHLTPTPGSDQGLLRQGQIKTRIPLSIVYLEWLGVFVDNANPFRSELEPAGSGGRSKPTRDASHRISWTTTGRPERTIGSDPT
jgi:hypothetical protein